MEHRPFKINNRKDGVYYCGQLLLNSKLGWWLPDSKFEKYAGYLGEVVQQWYG
jgi:hypothetical protein